MSNLEAMHRRARKMEYKLKHGKLDRVERRKLWRKWKALNRQIAQGYERKNHE